MSDQPLSQRSIQTFLEQLASPAPTPGGGSASALAGAMAAALVAMTCALTVGREKFASVEAEAGAIHAEAEQYRARLTRAIDADADAYDAVAAALKLPRDTAAAKATRSARLQEALAGAARVPAQTAAECSAVLDLAERAAPIVNPNAISDVIVAAHLAHAGLLGAVANVQINLPSLKDEALRADLAAHIADLTRDVDARVAAVLATADMRTPG